MKNNHYVGNQKFALFAKGEKNPLIVGPNEFVDIPDAYRGDPTYRKAVDAGVIQPFTPAKTGDIAERKAQDKARNAAANAKKNKDAAAADDVQKKDADAK